VSKNWTPSCINVKSQSTRWRILNDGKYYYIECKDPSEAQWCGGICGTQEYLGITDEEACRAYNI